MKALNSKVILKLQELYKQGTSELKSSDLQAIGLDASQRKIEIQNLKLEKDFLGIYSLSVLDKKLDLNGKPIDTNAKLLSKLQNLWHAGKKEIKKSELHELNIHSSFTEFKIGNFKLSKLLFTNSFEIAILDKSKNTNGKYLDNVVDADKVIDVLHKFEYAASMLSLGEVQLNKELEGHFKNCFESVRRGDTTDKGLIDLNIGNGKFVIELKLSKQLKKAGEAQRALGQVEQYTTKFKNNFMVVVAGDKNDKDDRSVKEIAAKVKSSKGFFQFLEAD